MTTNVVAGMSASHFVIPRKADIVNDGIPHKVCMLFPNKLDIFTDFVKVTIGIVDANCSFLYQAMPRVSRGAYLVANNTNNSEYPMLYGTANVFLDDNYVSQVQIQVKIIKNE